MNYFTNSYWLPHVTYSHIELKLQLLIAASELLIYSAAAASAL